MNLGIIDLAVLPDPKIIVLRAGDTVTLRAPVGTEPWTDDQGNIVGIRVVNEWLVPRRGDEVWGDFDGWFDASGPRDALYNVGGPQRDKLDRMAVNHRNEGVLAEDLYIKAGPTWQYGDWAQIRLYEGQLPLEYKSKRRYVKGEWRENQGFVRDVLIRTDREPIQTIWIMGAD